MKAHVLSAVLTLLVLATMPQTTEARPAPTPPPGWAGSAGAGPALTSGNSDTSTVNAAYELKRDTGGNIVQLKVEFLDTYKAQPPLPTVKKNDIAVLVSFAYKFE